MEDIKSIKFESIASNFEQVNQEFMRVKINVCYAGKNRNYSIIEKDVLEKMAKTVYGVPVVGEVDKEEKKFKGHGGKLEISDDGFEFVDTTIPYGFVDPTTPVTYETILENDGMTKNEYLTVSAYLWKGKFPELVEIFENGTVKQSMEIAVDSGSWDEDYEYFNVKEAHFQALCLLGVEACFESSKATIGYSLKDSESLYKEMLDKFKQFSLEGGDEVMDETVVETVVEGEETQVEDTETTNGEPKSGDETVKEEQEVESEQVEVVDYEAKFNELQIEYGKTIAKLDGMTEEFDRLQKFEQNILAEKRTISENELFEKFSTLENEKDFINLKENVGKYSLEEIENMCYAILGRKSFSLNEKTNIQTTQKLKVDTYNKKVDSDTYGGLLK